MAVDGAHIYWTSSGGGSGTIGRANLDGSGVNQNFITGAADPWGVAVNARHVFWANRGTNAIGRANLDGSAVDQSFIDSTSLRDPRGVALDRRYIYWANGPGKIARANLNGSGLNQNFIGAIKSPIGVAVDRAHVYWGAQGVGGAGAAIGRDDLEGSDAKMSFISGVSPGWVAVDALPSNAFSFGSKRALADGSVQLELRVPGPGALSIRRSAMTERASASAAKAGTVTLTLRPTAAAQKLLRRGRAVTVKVKTTFSPTGGSRASKTTRIKLRKARIFVPPPSTKGCRVANGGGITAAGGDKASFGGNAEVKRGPKGQESYVDDGPATPLKVKSTKILAVSLQRLEDAGEHRRHRERQRSGLGRPPDRRRRQRQAGHERHLPDPAEQRLRLGRAEARAGKRPDQQVAGEAQGGRAGIAWSRLRSHEAKLQAREVEVASLAERTLLGDPFPCLFVGDPVASGSEVPDEWNQRDSVGFGVRRGVGKRVGIHLYVLETRRAKPAPKRSRQ